MGEFQFILQVMGGGQEFKICQFFSNPNPFGKKALYDLYQIQGKKVPNRSYVPNMTLSTGLGTINVFVTLPLRRANID